VSGTENNQTGTLDEHLRLGAGFAAADRPRILRALSALTPHLSVWEHDRVDLEVSLKPVERDGWSPFFSLPAPPGRAVPAGRAAIHAEIEDLEQQHIEQQHIELVHLAAAGAWQLEHRCAERPVPRWHPDTAVGIHGHYRGTLRAVLDVTVEADATASSLL
jgi:hypothetical protein